MEEIRGCFFAGEPRIFAKILSNQDSFADILATVVETINQGADVIYIPVVFSNEGSFYLVTALDDKHRQSQMTLDTLLKEFPEQKFHLEIIGRNGAIVENLLKTIKKYGAAERLLISSNVGKILKRIKKEDRSIAVTFSILRVIGLYALYKTGLLHFCKKLKYDAIAVPEVIGASYLANQGFVRQLRERGIRVYIKLDNIPVQVQRLKAIEVNGFITEDVSGLKKYF